MSTFLVYFALCWCLAEGYSLYTILQPLLDSEKTDAQWRILTAAFWALLWIFRGLGHKERTQDILLWLMTGDTCEICDLWRSWPLLKSHEEGNKSWAEPCRKPREWTWSWFISVSSLLLLGSFHGRSLSVTLISLASSLPVTGAMC